MRCLDLKLKVMKMQFREEEEAIQQLKVKIDINLPQRESLSGCHSHESNLEKFLPLMIINYA